MREAANDQFPASSGLEMHSVCTIQPFFLDSEPARTAYDPSATIPFHSLGKAPI